MASASASASAPAPAGVAASAAAAAAAAARVVDSAAETSDARACPVLAYDASGTTRDAEKEKTRDVSYADSSDASSPRARTHQGRAWTFARARAVAWKSPSASRNGRVGADVFCMEPPFFMASRARTSALPRAEELSPRRAAPSRASAATVRERRRAPR